MAKKSEVIKNAASFTNDFVKYRGNVMNAPKPDKKKKNKVVKHIFPKGDDMEEHEVQKLMPPGPARICKDFSNNRWLCTWPGHGSCSRSWGIRSSSECVRETLTFAWTRAQLLLGVECTIEGLMLHSTTGASSSST